MENGKIDISTLQRGSTAIIVARAHNYLRDYAWAGSDRPEDDLRGRGVGTKGGWTLKQALSKAAEDEVGVGDAEGARRALEIAERGLGNRFHMTIYRDIKPALRIYKFEYGSAQDLDHLLYILQTRLEVVDGNNGWTMPPPLNHDLIERFVRRLKKIGIKVELGSNVPWIYLNSVNGKAIRQTYGGNHGFTVFMMSASITAKKKYRWTDIRIVFAKIREMVAEDVEMVWCPGCDKKLPAHLVADECNGDIHCGNNPDCPQYDDGDPPFFTLTVRY